MKKLSFLLMLLSLLQIAAAAPVKFVNDAKSWQAIVLMAKAANKKIFVDVYTKWCGPCKKMDAEVFSQDKVGAYFNENFINVKVDAEKGWGITFAENNKVDAYPTYLFFNPKGEVIYTALGFIPIPLFLETGNKVINNLPNGSALDELSKVYVSGKYDAAFLWSYIKTPGPVKEDRTELLEKYLTMLTDDQLMADSTAAFMNRNIGKGPLIPGSKTVDTYVRHFKKWPLRDGMIDGTWNVLSVKLGQTAAFAGASKNEVLLAGIISVSDAIEASDYARQREAAFLQCKYYLGAKDADGFYGAFKSFYNQAIVNADTALLYASDIKNFAVSGKLEKSRYPHLSEDQIIKGFRSEAWRTYNDFDALLFEYEYDLKRKQPELETRIKEWTSKAILLYRNNRLFANQYIIDKVDKKIATLK